MPVLLGGLLGGLLGTLHVLAAVAWVGSVIYHFVAVRPALRVLGEGRALAMEARATGRYTAITWISLGLLAVTGLTAVWQHWAELTPLLARPAGLILLFKLALVTVLGGIFLLQAYGYDPRARRLFRAVEAGHRPQVREAAADRNTLFTVYLIFGALIIALSVALSGLLRPA